VVALGPWSDDVFRPLGYEIPLAVKRGYHMHYGVKGNAGLGHPVRDADGGFALAPMSKGVRLTTGVEFADRDAPPSPVQLARDEPLVDDIDPPTARSVPGAHDRSIWANSASRQSRALIAIHDTTLGPAFGGCRMYPYASEQHAMTDVLRLSRGMIYKAAICELPYGGGDQHHV
jgi:glycine/D-amino acid oxidase-like deaminating enzyme